VKDEQRISHGFGITQKKDKIVLDAIVSELQVDTKVKYNKKGFFSMDVLDAKSLKKVKDYFFDSMKGVKSLDYKI